MKNGKLMRKKYFYLILSATVLICNINRWVYAGNLEMVEKQVEKLDQLNKEIVGSIPELPRKGSVRIKAKVYPYDHTIKYDILEKGVITLPDEEDRDNDE